MNEWTIISGIQLCPKKPTAAAAAKPTFVCVPCNKAFSKIHFLFVLSICLPSRLLVPLSSLIVIPYPFDPGGDEIRMIVRPIFVPSSNYCYFFTCIFTCLRKLP